MSLLTELLARLLLAPMLLIAAANLVKGYAEPGDGFSAGLIAALAVVLQSLGRPRRQMPLVSLRAALRAAFAGLALVLAVALVPMLWARPLLSHLPAPGAHVVYLGTLELHTAVLFDVGVFLITLGLSVGSLELLRKLEGGASP